MARAYTRIETEQPDPPRPWVIVGYTHTGTRVTFSVDARDEGGALRAAAKRAILNDMTAEEA